MPTFSQAMRACPDFGLDLVAYGVDFKVLNLVDKATRANISSSLLQLWADRFAVSPAQLAASGVEAII